MQPLNNDTSAQIVISMNIGGTYYNFNPSISNSEYRKNDILYDTEIVLTTLPTLENNGNRYTFAYWTTDIGTFIATSITFHIQENIKCCAVYNLSEDIEPPQT